MKTIRQLREEEREEERLRTIVILPIKPLTETEKRQCTDYMNLE